MDLREQLAALFLGNALHEDTIGTTAVEIPFYHSVAFIQSYYALSGHIVIREDIIFQVVPDLGDPCIGSSLSWWGWLYEVTRILDRAHSPDRAPYVECCRDHWLRGASLIPFTQFGRLGGRSQQPSFEDTLGHGCPGRCSRREIICC